MKNKITMNDKPQAEINTVLVAVTPDSNLSTDGTALDGVSGLRGSGIGATSKPSVRLLNIDCMEYLKTVPDKYFELAIVDPPYGINAAKMQMGSHPNRSRTDGFGSGPGVSTAVKLKGRLNTGSGKLKNRMLNKSEIDWDNDIPSQEYFSELFRVSKNQIIWGGNYFNLPPTRGIVAWNKLQPWDNFSQFELAWTSFDCPAKLYAYSNTGGANAEKKIHPTQKPVKVYKYLIDQFAKPGDKILDTHLGSGSIAIACHDYGFELVGCEINERYYNDTMKRFHSHIAQQSIFNK